MAKTLSGSFANGYVLSAASLDPVTVTGTIGLGSSTHPGALYGENTTAWTITNQGAIAGGTAAGVDLAAGGAITNDPAGTIGGYWGIATQGGPTTVVNSGAIAATGHVGAATPQ